mmetsp:Transcript_19316/g.28344  ORF Transcript_19316/g.28344 Transcript_19316/m.28344 type:complete len:984 (+) Transcript_19316:164-3115(+)
MPDDKKKVVSTLKPTAAAWKPTAPGGASVAAKVAAPPAAKKVAAAAAPKQAGGGGKGGGWGSGSSLAAVKSAKPVATVQPGGVKQAKNNRWKNVKDTNTPGGGDNNRDNNRGGGGKGRNNRNNRNDRNNNERNQNQHRNQNHNNEQQDSAPGGNWRGADGAENGDTADLLEPDASADVTRFTADMLMQLRQLFLDAPISWNETQADDDSPPTIDEEEETKPPAATPIPPIIAWTSETRVGDIDHQLKNPRGKPYKYDDQAPPPESPTNDNNNNNNNNNNKKKGRQGKKRNDDFLVPIEDVIPISKDEETRWKPKTKEEKKKKAPTSDATNADAPLTEEESADILQSAMLILNKITLTKFEKLSGKFIDSGITRSEELLNQAISIIVTKAQGEPHFCPMYAALCTRLAATPMPCIEPTEKKGKKFKKMLLNRCQHEFETTTEDRIAEATAAVEGDDDAAEEERKYRAGIIKKNYLGHITFIGEIYKADLLSIKVMLWCLPVLLTGDHDATKTCETVFDEEKVECFAKLMSTIGSALDRQTEHMKNIGKTEPSQQLAECWKMVEVLAGRRKPKSGESVPNISNRIKFMLQDLIDLRTKNWVSRRKVETAKTLKEIHKEADKELPKPRRSNSSNSLKNMGMRRGGGGSSNSLKSMGSSGDIRKLDKQKVDSDGFTTVGGVAGASSMKNMRRSASTNSMGRINSSESPSQMRKTMSGANNNQGGSKMKKSSSTGGGFAVLRESPRESSKGSGGGKGSRRNSNTKITARESAPTPPIEQPEPAAPSKSIISPDECKTKVKNLIKQYLYTHDTADAVLSYQELVMATDDPPGALDRGAACVEQSVFTIMESNKAQLDLFLPLWKQVCTGGGDHKGCISPEMTVKGLMYPLDLLSDVVIDAPLARGHTITIVGEMMNWGMMGEQGITFLLDAPDYFKSDGNAAKFAIEVLNKTNNDWIGVKENVDVVEKLMTEEEKSGCGGSVEEFAKGV